MVNLSTAGVELQASFDSSKVSSIDPPGPRPAASIFSLE